MKCPTCSGMGIQSYSGQDREGHLSSGNAGALHQKGRDPVGNVRLPVLKYHKDQESERLRQSGNIFLYKRKRVCSPDAVRHWLRHKAVWSPQFAKMDMWKTVWMFD